MVPNEVWMALEERGMEEITKRIRECMEENSFPSSWKVTQLRWIYKNKGEYTDIKNYRPIALTDTMYKIFMRIMTERLENAVEEVPTGVR